MVTELIRPVNYNPGISKKLIKSSRCSQLECNDESDEIEGYSALYIPILPLTNICLRASPGKNMTRVWNAIFLGAPLGNLN